jgi:hypothetical protein
VIATYFPSAFWTATPKLHFTRHLQLGAFLWFDFWSKAFVFIWERLTSPITSAFSILLRAIPSTKHSKRWSNSMRIHFPRDGLPWKWSWVIHRNDF